MFRGISGHIIEHPRRHARACCNEKYGELFQKMPTSPQRVRTHTIEAGHPGERLPSPPLGLQRTGALGKCVTC